MKNLFKIFAIALTGVIAVGNTSCNTGSEETLRITPASLSFDAEGLAVAGATVTVTGSDWSAASGNGWITVTPTSGEDGDTFTVTVTPNTVGQATTRNGSVTVTGATGSKTVNVTQLASGAVAVTDVVLDENTAHLITRDELHNTLTLTATVFPPTADNQSVSWSSEHESVATVSGGVVTAVAPGITTITVTTAEGGFTAECEVTVTDCGFIVADANLPAKLSWDAALTACPDGWRVPTADELACICEVYHNEGDVAGWPIESNYWSSTPMSGFMGEAGGACSLYVLSNPDCTVAAAMFNSQLLYVRCVKDVE